MAVNAIDKLQFLSFITINVVFSVAVCDIKPMCFAVFIVCFMACIRNSIYDDKHFEKIIIVVTTGVQSVAVQTFAWPYKDLFHNCICLPLLPPWKWTHSC